MLKHGWTKSQYNFITEDKLFREFNTKGVKCAGVTDLP